VKVLRFIATGALTAVLISLIGCKITPPTQLTVQTVANVTENCSVYPCTPKYIQVPAPGIRVWGNYIEPEVLGPAPTGTLASYSGTTSSSDPNCSTVPSIYQPQNLLLPAEWSHWVREPSMCTISSSVGLINTEYVGYGYIDAEVEDDQTANNAVITWGCTMPLNTMAATAPSFAMAGSIPASITIPGQVSFTTSYGMPILYLYSGTNGVPNLAATVTASSVTSGGGSAAFPLPSSLATSSYGLVTANAMSDGSYLPNGINFFAVGSSQTIAGNPFGVAVSGLTHTRGDLHTCPPKKTTTSNYLTYPVVSLYSANQVLINGVPVSVGSNPTAVATYQGPPSTNSTFTNCDNIIDGYTGQTQAIVANSGSNTVSILDTVNKVLLSTVTVGNKPVALAVSSDGSTAYVANYADSTITRVNLSAGTATSTIAVGGQPTSVALTSAGILWVGGVGFLTEIDTQTMGVVATQTAINKTIVALGYSDQVNELIATSTDTGGNVLVEQISPGSVQTGNLYAPMASHTVSNLGTHMDQSNGTWVRAFTNTLASVRSISANQVGAPPLVVYDAWVTVSATPTGFTITDIADNYVFDSVSTPSPITAIAVDPKLNVAYLAMPDSNTLLTVPLPGTGN